MKALFKRSIITSIVVGSILIAINQYDHIMAGNFTPNLIMKMALTPLIPFLVSFISGYQAIKHTQKTQA